MIKQFNYVIQCQKIILEMKYFIKIIILLLVKKYYNKLYFIINIILKYKAAWLLKCNSLIRKQYLDDLEVDEEGQGDILLDDT